MATQASEQSGNHFIENVRPSLLRGGRLTKFKGQAVSLAPMFGGAAMVLMTSAAMIFPGSAAVAGSCIELAPGSGVWDCTGAAAPATDSSQFLAAAAGGALTVTTSGGFGIDTSLTGGHALVLSANFGTTDLTFTDSYASPITGYVSGITDSHTGTGTTRISVTGTVTGLTGNGIAASTKGGTGLTVDAVNVYGGNRGIWAINQAGGVTSVTASGQVTGTAGAGVLVSSGYSSTGLVVSTGPVSGGNHGIKAKNLGTGAASITASGMVSASSGAGIYAYNYYTATDLTVSAQDISAQSGGIRATNYGTGATSVTSTGIVTGNSTGLNFGADGIQANNGANATTLTVNAGSALGGRSGIFALNAGTGATSITATGYVQGRTFDGIYARNSNAASTGGLTISAQKVTGGRYGIRADNAGAGVISVTATGAVTGGATTDGIALRGNTSSTDFTVIATDVTGARFGIDARNTGTGATSVTATGTVTGGSNDGITTLTNGTDITVNAGVVTGGRYGILARNNGTGTTSVTATGTVTGTGNDGIQVINGTATLGGVLVSAAAVTGANDGIEVTNSGGGSTSITATGAVAGSGRGGIFAYNKTAAAALTVDTAAVSGANFGIYAKNRGTGATSVTTSGAVTGTTSSGIDARNSSTVATGGLAINTAAVSGGLYGIRARNYGNGATGITATGPVAGGAASSGIDVININSTSTSLTVNAGDVYGGLWGVKATNGGSGATSVTTTGIVASSIAEGIYVRNSAGTALTIDTQNNVTGGSSGIKATNNGTGALTISVGGNVSGATGQGIYALNGANGSPGMTISQAAGTTTSGALGGILAFSATGSLTINALGTSAATSAYGNDGIHATTIAGTTDLSITANSAIGASNGIYAKNSGTGATSVTTTGTVNGNNGYGIDARASGTSLNVGVVTVSGRTQGIVARNYGTGPTNVTATGIVSGVNNTGIYVNTYNGSSTGDVTVVAQAVSGGGHGIYANNVGFGATSITATGAVSGTGNSGIYTRSAGTNLDVTATDVIGAEHGIYARNSGIGTTSVTATGTVSGAVGLGIYARGSGTDLTVSAATVTGAQDGIQARNLGSGANSVTATGTVTGALAYDGILATNSSTGTDLTVSSAAASGGLRGIYARNSGTGATSVTSTGQVTGTTGDGIFALGNGTSMTVNTGAVTGGANGIRAINNLPNGAIDMAINGAVAGGTGYGIYTKTTGFSSNSTINLNAGAAVGATSGKAIFNGQGNSNITVNTGASVTGNISLGNGSDTLTFAGGDFSGVTLFDGGDDTTSTDGFIDTLNFNGAGGALVGANILNWENVSIGSGATVNFTDNALTAGALTVAAGGVLSTAGSSFALTGNMANAGKVNMQNSSTGDTVTVSGNYTGGGALALDVDTTLDTADTLAIAGNSSGTTLVTLNNLTPLVATGNDITLVTVGGTSAAGDFALAGGAITAGAFDYDISYATGNFMLVKQLNSVGVTYLAAPMALGEFNHTGTLAQRIEGRTKSDGQAVWTSMSGRNARVSLANGSSTDSRLWSLKFGADLELDPGSAGRWVLGFNGQYSTSNSTMSDPLLGYGTTSTSGVGIGMTATWYGETGFYLDAQAQVNWLDSDISSSSSGGLVTGLRSTAYALSIEGGQRFELGSNAALVPQAQITWGNTNVGSFTDSVGNSVALGGNTSLVGRLGLAYEFAITGDTQKLYVIGSVLHDFSNASSVTVGGVTTSTAVASPTSAEIGFGGTTRVGAVEFYGEAGLRTALGGRNDQAYSGTFGLRMKF